RVRDSEKPVSDFRTLRDDEFQLGAVIDSCDVVSKGESIKCALGHLKDGVVAVRATTHDSKKRLLVASQIVRMTVLKEPSSEEKLRAAREEKLRTEAKALTFEERCRQQKKFGPIFLDVDAIRGQPGGLRSDEELALCSGAEDASKGSLF